MDAEEIRSLSWEDIEKIFVEAQIDFERRHRESNFERTEAIISESPVEIDDSQYVWDEDFDVEPIDTSTYDYDPDDMSPSEYGEFWSNL
jgi:hypothetical protein